MLPLPLTAIALAAAATMPGTLPAQNPSQTRSKPPVCSAETLPPAEKAAMEREYGRRTREDGKAAADSWLQKEARAFVIRLVDRGVCTMPSGAAKAGTPRARSAKTPLGKNGKPCKRTRMENRNVANLSGGAMTMVLVPVCAD